MEASYDRFHDFERTMQLNYFGALRVNGRAADDGGAKGGPDHQYLLDRRADQCAALSAYVASKAALRMVLLRGVGIADVGIDITTINMPLVRTPMIAPTKVYTRRARARAEEAAEKVVTAIVNAPARIATDVGMLGLGCHALAPQLGQIIMNTAYRLSAEAEVLARRCRWRHAGVAGTARHAAPAARRPPLICPCQTTTSPRASDAVDDRHGLAAHGPSHQPDDDLRDDDVRDRVGSQALRDVIGARMLCFHRFRQRVAGQGGYALGNRSAVRPGLARAPRGLARCRPDGALEAVTSDLISTPLDPGKPMWQFHLIDRAAAAPSCCGSTIATATASPCCMS